jgi:hypothetical protein
VIGGSGQTPNLLRQWELGKVPKAMTDEHGAAAGERTEGTKKKRRPRWLRFWRER